MPFSENHCTPHEITLKDLHETLSFRVLVFEYLELPSCRDSLLDLQNIHVIFIALYDFDY
jgi:hypothetical protein